MGQYDPRVDGYDMERVTADGTIAGGIPIVLHGFSMLSGGTAGVVVFYDDTDAGTAANKRGGHTGIASSWTNVVGLHGKFTEACYLDVDANVSEICVFFRRL